MREKTGFGETRSENAPQSDASVVENFENHKERDEKSSDGGDIMFRDGNGVEYRKALARDVYERRVGRGMYQMREALQDSMLGLREAMDAVLDAAGGGSDCSGFAFIVSVKRQGYCSHRLSCTKKAAAKHR